MKVTDIVSDIIWVMEGSKRAECRTDFSVLRTTNLSMSGENGILKLKDGNFGSLKILAI